MPTAFAPLSDVCPAGLPAEFLVYDPSRPGEQVELVAEADDGSRSLHERT
jgi:hypothetical protein